MVLLLKKPELVDSVRESDLASETARRVWRAFAAMKPLPADWAARLTEDLPASEKALVSGLLMLLGEVHSDDPAGTLKRPLELRRRGDA